MKSDYEQYLARAERELPGVDIGGYGKFQGRLVKKLDAEAFAQRLAQYRSTRASYDEILERGDTVNDAIVHLLREHASELLLEED